MGLCGHLGLLVWLHRNSSLLRQHTLRVLNDARDLALHDGDGRVGGTQVNTNDRALDLLLAALSISARKGRGPEGGCAECC
jgi:hypothetical protein